MYILNIFKMISHIISSLGNLVYIPPLRLWFVRDPSTCPHKSKGISTTPCKSFSQHPYSVRFCAAGVGPVCHSSWPTCSCIVYVPWPGWSRV